MKVVSFREALFEAILDAFYRDPTLIAFGEENRDWGGAFGVYQGLTECLPYLRLFNTRFQRGPSWEPVWGMPFPEDGPLSS